MTFNAEEYWRDRPVKKCVVYLSRRSGRKVLETDTKIVAARTERGAKATAIEHCLINPTHIDHCRLATPADLGCIPAGSCAWCRGNGVLYGWRNSRHISEPCSHCTGSAQRAAA